MHEQQQALSLLISNDFALVFHVVSSSQNFLSKFFVHVLPLIRATHSAGNIK
jgi:hypothetical protein